MLRACIHTTLDFAPTILNAFLKIPMEPAARSVEFASFLAPGLALPNKR
jgi:hypothetical protein